MFKWKCIKTQGLGMVSRDGIYFYWVLSRYLQARDCVITFIAERTVTSFPQARNNLDICITAYIWILPVLHNHHLTKPEKFSGTKWKFQPTSVSSVSVGMFLACNVIALFYEQNKYFVTLGFYLWKIQSTGRRGILNTLLCWICGIENLNVYSWWKLVKCEVSTVYVILGCDL